MSLSPIGGQPAGEIAAGPLDRLPQRIEAALAAQSRYDWVANGRFKGGYITRHYGDPGNGFDAVQLEISQRNYMDEATFAWDDTLARPLQAVIRSLLERDA